jgi:outer membrane protein TolC
MSSPAWADFGTDRHLIDSLEIEFRIDHDPPAVLFDKPTLNDYLVYASSNSSELKRAFFHWKTAMEKSGYIGALPDPFFSFGYFYENVETRVGPQKMKFGLKQSFPWFGTLGDKKDIAEEEARAMYRKFQSAKLKLFYDVKSAYYDYYYLGREISLTKESFELLRYWESIALANYKVAQKQYHDLIKAQVELGKLEDKLITLDEQLEPMAAQLRAALNLPDSVAIPVPESIDVSEFEISSDSVVMSALENNTDLKALAHFTERERAGMSLAGKAFLPNFSIGADYIETGPAINSTLPESGKDPWIISAGISLPIWFGKNNAKKREAEARYQASVYNYTDSQKKLTAYVKQIISEYSDALRKTELYRDGLIPKAEQSLNAGFKAYQTGETDFLNILDAQRQLLEFQLNFEKAKSTLAKKRAEIEMIIGNDLESNQQF